MHLVQGLLRDLTWERWSKGLKLALATPSAKTTQSQSDHVTQGKPIIVSYLSPSLWSPEGRQKLSFQPAGDSLVSSGAANVSSAVRAQAGLRLVSDLQGNDQML